MTTPADDTLIPLRTSSNIPKTRWAVAQCDADTDAERLKALLVAGWEPFAAHTEVVWLRALVWRCATCTDGMLTEPCPDPDCTVAPNRGGGGSAT